MSTLYRVRKVYDRREDKPIKPGSREASVMCGQAAIAYVPSKKTIQMIADLDSKKITRKEFNQWESESEFKDIWKRQDKLEPIIGQFIYFSSVKMDAGWYRTSPVLSFEYDAEKKIITITTEGKILEVVEDD